MSFSAIKTVTNVGKQIISQSRHTLTPSKLSRSFLCVRKERQMTRAFARSMWYLSSNTTNGSGPGIHFCHSVDNLGSSNITGLNWQNVSQTCSCGHRARLHTEGDKELSKFLEREIELEKIGKQANAQIPGFILSTDGASATLTKTQDGETITVKFNVNHSVEAEQLMDEDVSHDEEPAAPQMRSYPEFVVEIAKDSQSVVAIKCHFTDTEFDEEDIQQGDLEDKDFFLIDEVSIHSGTPSENTYCVGSEVMDGTLYDMILKMMNERGIDNEFAEKLSDVASSVDHGQYIKFLEGFKHIVDC